MSEYAILTEEREGDRRLEPRGCPCQKEVGKYCIERPNAKTAKALQTLRVRSKHLSDKKRYEIADAEGLTDWLLGEKDDDDPLDTNHPVKEAELSVSEYVNKAARVLFPTAPIADNEDYIDREVFWEAESDFLPRIEPPSASSSQSFGDLTSLVRLAQTMQTKQNTSDTEKA